MALHHLSLYSVVLIGNAVSINTCILPPPIPLLSHLHSTFPSILPMTLHNPLRKRSHWEKKDVGMWTKLEKGPTDTSDQVAISLLSSLIFNTSKYHTNTNTYIYHIAPCLSLTDSQFPRLQVLTSFSANYHMAFIIRDDDAG